MRPIAFVCRETLPLAPAEIAGQILDLSRWPEFRGYGPLPGILSAQFERQTADIVGTRIRVTSCDGSTHVEEIVEWEPERRLRLEMKEFSPPLSRLATRFEETWQLHPLDSGTAVERSFRMHARSPAMWPLLWGISCLLQRAIARHLRSLRTP